MNNIITFSDMTIDKINVPETGDGYIYDNVHNKSHYCDICGCWLSESCVKLHCDGKKHRKMLNGCTDHILSYTPPPPPPLTEQEKISKLITKTATDAIDNVKKECRAEYYSNKERYFRITNMKLSDGISSLENFLEHQLILLQEMNLPDITDVNYSDGDSCPYGCSNHSFQQEANMLARVEGIKVAMHILITNFGKDLAEEDTSGWATPIISGVAEKVYYYEDPRWCIEYYKTIAAADEKVETERAEEARAAMSAYSKAMQKTRLAEQARMIAQEKERAEKAAEKALEKKAREAATAAHGNDLKAIRAEHKAIKTQLHEFEVVYEQQHGRRPLKKKDWQPVFEDYERYIALRETEKRILGCEDRTGDTKGRAENAVKINAMMMENAMVSASRAAITEEVDKTPGGQCGMS